MTTDLRAQVVEAMARKRWAERYAAVTRVPGAPRQLPEWDGEFIEESEEQLDAALDVLGKGDTYNEWVTAADAINEGEPLADVPRPLAADLLFVLRAGKGSE